MESIVTQKKEKEDELYLSFKAGLEDLKNKRVVKLKDSNLFK